MHVKRTDIEDAARRWVGTRFRHQGRNKAGIDCAGLVLEVGKELDAIDPDFEVSNYSRNAQDSKLLGSLVDNLSEHLITDKKIGSVLVFRVKQFPCHLGIVTWKHGCYHIVHASLAHRKVVEEPYANEWPVSVTHCFEFLGVEE